MARPGTYFWEADPQRALEWAEGQASRGRIAKPSVVGAVIDLRNCLDLVTRENLEFLRLAHAELKATLDKAGLPMPRNQNPKGHAEGDEPLRYLDCAVIRRLHRYIEDDSAEQDLAPFDTVRGLFVEGPKIYPGSGFRSQTHTQIAVRNRDAIKGYFRPRG